MTLSQFIAQYLGQPVDTDGAYGGQCMDLMHRYKYDVLGETDYYLLAAPSAIKVWENFNRDDLFDRIPETPDTVPKPGDIVFFSYGVGPYGHVAIVEKADINNLTVIEQNWNGVQKVTRRKTNYNDVAGYLRYKGKEKEQTVETWPNKDKYDALIRSFSAFNDQGRTNYYSDDPSRLTADIIDREETIEDLRLELRDKEQEYTQKQKELQIQLDQIQKDLDKERNAVIEAQEDLKTTKDKLSTIQGTLLECEHKIEEMATNTEKDEEILTLRGDIVQLQAENEMIRRVSLYGLIDWVKSLKLK